MRDIADINTARILQTPLNLDIFLYFPHRPDADQYVISVQFSCTVYFRTDLPCIPQNANKFGKRHSSALKSGKPSNYTQFCGIKGCGVGWHPGSLNHQNFSNLFSQLLKKFLVARGGGDPTIRFNNNSKSTLQNVLKLDHFKISSIYVGIIE